MSGWPDSLLLTFIPLFIAIDAIGSVLYLIDAGKLISRKEHDRIAGIAVMTAAVVGLAFIFFGRLILTAMNISIGAFAIAGGIILIVSVYRRFGDRAEIVLEKEALIAIVPLGTPLLAGPATITALLLLSTQYDIWVVSNIVRPESARCLGYLLRSEWNTARHG